MRKEIGAAPEDVLFRIGAAPCSVFSRPDRCSSPVTSLSQFLGKPFKESQFGVYRYSMNLFRLSSEKPKTPGSFVEKPSGKEEPTITKDNSDELMFSVEGVWSKDTNGYTPEMERNISVSVLGTNWYGTNMADRMYRGMYVDLPSHLDGRQNAARVWLNLSAHGELIKDGAPKKDILVKIKVKPLYLYGDGYQEDSLRQIAYAAEGTYTLRPDEESPEIPKLDVDRQPRPVICRQSDKPIMHPQHSGFVEIKLSDFMDSTPTWWIKDPLTCSLGDDGCSWLRLTECMYPTPDVTSVNGRCYRKFEARPICTQDAKFAPAQLHTYSEQNIMADESYIYLLIKKASIKLEDQPVRMSTITNVNDDGYIRAATMKPEERKTYRRYPGVLTRYFVWSGADAYWKKRPYGLSFAEPGKPNNNYDEGANYLAIGTNTTAFGRVSIHLFWGDNSLIPLTPVDSAPILEAAELNTDDTVMYWLFDIKNWVDNDLLKNSCLETTADFVPVYDATGAKCNPNGDLIVVLHGFYGGPTTLELPIYVLNVQNSGGGKYELISKQRYNHEPLSGRNRFFEPTLDASGNINFTAPAANLSVLGKTKISATVRYVKPLKGDTYAFAYPLSSPQYLASGAIVGFSRFWQPLHANEMYAALQDDTLIEYFRSESEASKHCRVLLQPDPADANRVDNEGKISCYTPGMVPLTDSYEPSFSTQVAADWFGRTTKFLLSNEKDFAMILRHRLGGDEPFEITADKTLKIYDKEKSKDGVSDFIISYRKDPAQVGGDELRELDCGNDASGITCACYETYTPEGCPQKPMRESITFSADEVNQVFKERLEKMCAAYGCTRNGVKKPANASLQNKSYTDAADITDTFEKVKNTPKSHSADTYRSTDNVKIQRVNLFATTATRLLPQQLYIRETPGSSDNAKSLMALAAKLTFNDQKMSPTSNTLDIKASDVKLIAPLQNESNNAEGEIPIQQSCVGAPDVCFSIENGGVPGFSGRAKVDLISDYNVPIALSGTDYNTFKYTYSLTNHELQNVTYIRDNINCLKGAIGCNNFSILRHIKPAQ